MKENGARHLYPLWLLGNRSISGADPGFVERGGGRSGYRERHRREGFWRAPVEDPLWNFNGDARHRCIVDLEGTGGIWGMLLQKSFHKFD